MLTSKSAKIDDMFGFPDAEIVLEVSLYTFGVDVCVGTMGRRDVVKTRDATGFHKGAPLISCVIWIPGLDELAIVLSASESAYGFVFSCTEFTLYMLENITW